MALMREAIKMGQKFANALAGAAAHMGGNGQAYERNKMYEEEMRREQAGRQQLAQYNQQQALSKERQESMLYDAYKVKQFLSNNDTGSAQQLLTNRLGSIQQLGGDPQHTQALLQRIQSGDVSGAMGEVTQALDWGVMNGMIKAPASQGAAAAAPSSVREFEFFQTLTPEDQKTYLDVKRQQNTWTNVGGVPGVGNMQQGTFAPAQTQTGPATIGSESQAQAAIAGAKETATQGAQVAAIEPRGEANASVKQEQEQIKNDKVYAAYEAGMTNLMDSLGNTDTGPFIGRLPAITANQQTADAAVAAIAPIMKTIFREAGEGTFSEGDQKLLLDLIPKRDALPAAREAAFKNIDMMIKSKLGIPLDESSEATVADDDPLGIMQ